MAKKKHNPSEREFQKFVKEVSQLEPMEFMGLVRIFNIDIFKQDEEKTPRSFEEVFSEVLDGFIKASPMQRKNIMKILKAANGKKQ
jgi:hypothetical protein